MNQFSVCCKRSTSLHQPLGTAIGRNPGARSCWLILLAVFSSASVCNAQETQDSIEGESEVHEAQIFIAEPDGSKMKLLMRHPEYGFQGSPEWSRDGNVIAFDCCKQGEAGTAAIRIGVVNSDGTNLRILGDGAMPSLSPKGDRMFYNRYGKGVWLQTISEPPGEPILVDRRGWGTAWSPDGTRVAYASYNPVNLVVYDVEQQTRSSLFDDATNPYRQILWNFVWSPDSKQIAFKGVKAADGKSVLAIVDARGDRFHHSVIFEGDLLPTVTWNPDGKQILFASHCEETNNPRQIYSINPLMADQPKLLPQQARNRWLQDMSFSPDGTKLAIMAHRPFKK